jgi:AraC-like DNA-binding protein
MRYFDGVALRARRVSHSQTFLAVIQRLRENGTFRPKSVDKCEKPTPRVLDLEPQILETVEENPSTSTRQLAREFQVSQFVLCRTFKEQGLHRYHVQREQALQPNCYIRR